MRSVYCRDDIFCEGDLLAVADKFDKSVSSLRINDEVAFETRDTME